VLWIRANDTDNTVAFDNLTLIANGLYASAYFHKSPPGKVIFKTRIIAIRFELQPEFQQHITNPKHILVLFHEKYVNLQIS